MSGPPEDTAVGATAARPSAPPLVGASANFMAASWERPFYTGKQLQYVETSLLRWIRSGGALPVVVPDPGPGEREALAAVAARLDGLVLSGGADVSPTSYGEQPLRPEWAGDAERDAFEIALVAAFRDAGKPVLGVCRGSQLLNVAAGGTLYQDVIVQGAASHIHRDAEVYDRLAHPTRVAEGSLLRELYGVGEGVTNSVHHQAVKDVAPGFVATAWSDDGLVEAIEPADRRAGPFCLGVQWHPEWMTPGGGGQLDPRTVLAAFVAACGGGGRGQ